MAEFGIKSTELAGPQGAGSQPIRPVQGPADFTPDLSGMGSLFTGLVDKTKKADPWSGAISKYIQEMGNITQANQTGGLTNASATVARNKLTTQFQIEGANSGWGEDYIKSLSAVRQGLGVGSGINEVEGLAQDEKKAQQDLFNDAQKNGMFPGVTNFSDLDPKSQQALLNAQQSVRFAEAEGKRAEELRAQIRAANGETRAATAADRDAQEAMIKKQAVQALGPMMRDSFSLFDAQLSQIMKMDGDDKQKQQTFAGVMNAMKSQAFTVLQGDQVTYQNYTRSLEGLEKLGNDMLDPAKRTEEMASELKRRILEAQLWATEAPSARRAAGVAALYPNSPPLQMMVSNVGMQLFNADIMAGEQQKPLPSVTTGDTNAQKATFGSIREAVRSSAAGGIDGQAKFDAAASTFGATVKSISTFKAGSSNTMEYALEAIASPEYGMVVNKKAFNERDGAEALQTISDVYVPAFTNALRTSLEQPLGDTRYENGKPAADNASMMQIIDFQVGNDGQIRIVKSISPEFRKGITASDAYLDSQVRSLQRSLEPRINQLIRAASHLEGTTDYKTVFERIAPQMLRGFYVPAQYLDQLKSEGYSGTGNVANPANWRGTTGFPSERKGQ